VRAMCLPNVLLMCMGWQETQGTDSCRMSNSVTEVLLLQTGQDAGYAVKSLAMLVRVPDTSCLGRMPGKPVGVSSPSSGRAKPNTHGKNVGHGLLMVQGGRKGWDDTQLAPGVKLKR